MRDFKINLSEELMMINDVTLRAFVYYCLEKTPEYFWKISSSSSKTHHPDHSNIEPGGLVNHTKAVVYFGKALCKAYELRSYAIDLVISSCILHDIVKRGFKEEEKTVKGHANDSAQFVRKCYDEYSHKDCITGIDVILGCITKHMGIWSEPQKYYPINSSQFERIVHTADFLASQKEVHLQHLEV